MQKPTQWRNACGSRRPRVGLRFMVRQGLTLAELLVATTITAVVVAALGVFAKAVMDGNEHAMSAGNATQASRVVTARISNAVAHCRKVLAPDAGLRAMPGMDEVLILWERDGEPGDSAPGKPNLVELVLFTSHRKNPAQLLELRPRVDPSLVAPIDQPAMWYSWINRFRDGHDVGDPIALVQDLGGVHFDIEEYPEPEGIGGVVQQNVRVALCISPIGGESTVFFAACSRRSVTDE